MKKGGKPNTPTVSRRAPAAHARSRAAQAAHTRSRAISAAELERMQDRLRELTETVDALRNGTVDAVVVSGPRGSQIYSLAGAEHPYRIYVERMQEGAATVSPEGIVLYTNQRFSDMLHQPLERVIGSDIRDYVGEHVWRDIADVVRGAGRATKHAADLQRGDLPPLPVSVAASGLHIDDREMLCLVVTDLTEQQQNAELRIAKEIAEKANEAKDDFLAALSHELRTPLTPALVSAASIESDPDLPAHLRDEIALVRRNVQLEARLIDDLLDLTRIARGKLEMHPAPIDLDQILDEAVRICRADIAAKQIDLEITKQATATTTEGDGIRIQQVLWNLLRNAIKFTPRHGRISVRTADLGPGRIGIEVVDTGIGFDAVAATKIFNAFEQGGREITRQFGGLGLGLAISRSIAQAHGGTIRASSDGPGRGATFLLELPLRRTAPDAAEVNPLADAAALPAAGLRILLVEDHKDTRMVLERVLRRQKHHVLTASDARGALEIADTHPLDIVISDLGLPDQSGLDLMRQLRDRHGLRGIAVSGYGMEEDVAKSHSAGFVHHLTKPICVQRLRQLIETVTPA